MTSEKKRKFENGEYPQKTNVKTPKIPGQKFYAVHRGRQPGIYHTWPECQAQILGYTGAIYKKFDSQAEAEDFVKNGWRAKGLKPKIKEQIKAPPVPVEEDESDYTIVYTDGSSRGNGKDHCRAGVGVYFGEKDPRNVSERLLGKQTNQRAEVTAAIRAIEKVGDDKQPLEIRTDSQYLIKAITSWIHNWKKRGWVTVEDKSVENKDLFMKLDELINQRPGPVRFKHVKAHIGIPGNEAADMLANAGATLN